MYSFEIVLKIDWKINMYEENDIFLEIKCIVF